MLDIPQHSTLYYDQLMFDRDVRKLTSLIKGSERKYDRIVGLSRGGLPLAVCLSHRLGIPMTTIDWSTSDTEAGRESNWWLPENINDGHKILVVDDMVDSGKSLADLFAEWDNCAAVPLHVENIDVAVIFNNSDVDVLFSNTAGVIRATHWARSFSRLADPRWIVYYWESDRD